jgi:hypothetical protein
MQINNLSYKTISLIRHKAGFQILIIVNYKMLFVKTGLILNEKQDQILAKKSIKKKQRLEFILLTIFLIAGLCTFFKVPFSKWSVMLSGLLLGSLYFYVAFWLYAEFSIPLIIRIVAGLSYSLTICAGIFCFLNWPLWQLYSIISFTGLVLMAVICLFNKNKPDYKQLFYRCIFFIVLLSVIYGTKRFLA